MIHSYVFGKNPVTNIKEELKMKKAITLLLALVMVLSLAACGGSTAAPATEAPKTETPAAPAATEAAPAEEGKVFNIYAWNEE